MESLTVSVVLIALEHGHVPKLLLAFALLGARIGLGSLGCWLLKDHS